MNEIMCVTRITIGGQQYTAEELGEEKAKEFQEKWIPKEEAYFEKFHVQDDTLEIMWNLKVL